MALGVSIIRKLGGPSNPVKDYMMQASRNQRSKLFCWENESALRNTLGPGPTKYNHADMREIVWGHKFGATFGTVSWLFVIVF